MGQPQSDREVEEVVTALRVLDRDLDVRWEPKAEIVTKGQYTVLGKRTDPVYDGRWQIIRWNSATKTNAHREYEIVVTVTELVPDGTGHEIMLSHGAYAPLGMWLVDYMKRWDTAQSHFAAAMDKLWKEHEKADEIHTANSDAAFQEAAEKVYAETGGGKYWMGGGQGNTANAPWLGDAQKAVAP